jgi:hypothetical protein
MGGVILQEVAEKNRAVSIPEHPLSPSWRAWLSRSELYAKNPMSKPGWLAVNE